MKDSNKDDVVNLNEIFILLAKLLAVFVMLIVSLRFPVLWIKVPLAFAVLIFGWRWMFRTKKKVVSKDPKTSRAKRVTASSAPAAVGEGEKAGSEGGDAVRALIALDAAGEFGKAKSLIQQLNGEEFPESVGKELAVVAANYFPVELEPTEDGVRFKLT